MTSNELKTIKISAQAHKAAKMLAAQDGMTLSDWLAKLITDKAKNQNTKNVYI
jgi:predicted HicB family RNase H-like nuclease